jgi:radical SAM protein with 4Fe4S-binding SPASM domain
LNYPLVSSRSVADFSLWDRMKENRSILKFHLELTARCNNDCRHCYINLPAGDGEAQEREPGLEEIMKIADQATGMGALWCTITGGEPLLRNDFCDVYLGLKRKGLLVSVYTNATLIKEEHVALFKRYPPQDIEVTVYGVSRETYESVTRRSGSYDAFMRGLTLLLESGVKVRLKAMAVHSNIREMPQIADFCRARTRDYFRFDPHLQLRLDRDPARNDEIRSERLASQQIVALERADSERFHALEKACDKLINPEYCKVTCDHLFRCGTGVGSFVLGYDGNFRLCMSLYHPDCVYDLRRGSLIDAWQNFVPKVRDIRSERKEFLETCRTCPIINLCMWCPAHAYLETGEMDARVDYFCKVARARAEALNADVQLCGRK